MIRIVQSEHAARVLTAEIEGLEGIPRAGTSSWGEPIAHPDGTRWAVILSDLQTSVEGDVTVLPSDWYPEEAAP